MDIAAYLKKLKRDLAKMKPAKVTDAAYCDPCDHMCMVCDLRRYPIDRALVAAVFMGRDLAVETKDFRDHILQNHICEEHLVHVNEIFRFLPGWTKEDSGKNS